MSNPSTFKRLSLLSHILRTKYKSILFIALGFTLCYYLLLMVALMIRFESLPNYINSYEWWFHVKRIWQSTPSMIDAFLITKDEWFYEIGHMNYDFGIGISEWSLFINPFKVFGVFVLGTVIAINYFLLRLDNPNCSFASTRASKVATGFGGTLVAVGSITMSWVVCCSTPTWVVGLAMMGLSVSASLWLEPIGIWVNILGFSILFLAMYLSLSRAMGATANDGALSPEESN